MWQPADGGIEATAFDRLSNEACEGLEAEARAPVALLADGGTTIYRRYARWWATLTSAEVRVLGGGRSARGARRRGGAAARRAPS